MSSASLDLTPVSTDDFRRLAAKRLPSQLFNYIDGGAYSETTLRANREAFSALQLRQRVLKNVDQVDTKIQLLGRSLAMPLILAPVALAGSFARRGEVQALRAANQAQLPFTLSSVAICGIEELARANCGPFWYQLYVIRERQYALTLMQRALQAGCDTLVFTVDLPLLADRYRDKRNGLSGAEGIWANLRRYWDFASHPRWLWDVALRGQPLIYGNFVEAVPDARSLKDFKRWVDSQFDPSMTWDDLGWIRDNWPGKLLLKGILDAEDAEKAVALGADGIIVSNHGGRQLDGAPPTLAALPAIAAKVKGRLAIIVDSGVRDGVDVIKALALGADACMIGRAWAYALAARGERGVSQLLRQFQNEFRVTMALTGVTQVSQIDGQILYSHLA